MKAPWLVVTVALALALAGALALGCRAPFGPVVNHYSSPSYYWPAAAMSVHFSSRSDNWPTPTDFFDRVANEHGPFDLDVCASPSNAKCRRFYCKRDDGLKQQWTGRVWMNPPYGREIKRWMRKAFESAQAGATVVCLVPSRTDTAWWHDYAAKGRVEFIRGRLKFGGHKNSAPFPSALVIFAPP